MKRQLQPGAMPPDLEIRETPWMTMLLPRDGRIQRVDDGPSDGPPVV